MSEFEKGLSLVTVKSRAVKGVLTLTGRTLITQLIAFFGFFFLTIFLGRADIGLFFAVSEIVAILGYFSDIGLAAALIQKKERPGVLEIRSTFTVQQVLVFVLVTTIFLITPFLQDFYKISKEGVWLLWALTAGFFLASLKTIPSVLLERDLRFDLLALVEILETFIFYGLAVYLAWQGWGVLSYALAVIARGLVGVVMIYILSPWSVGFAFERQSLKALLRFGLPYQGNTFLAVVKDRLMNVVLWKIIGADGVGILGWAQKWAQMPLRFIMDSVMKVTFPAYSRMQDDKQDLKKAIEKTLFFVSFFTFPILVGIALLVGPLIHLIPNYEKWNIALMALTLYLVNSAWASITTPITNALSATGRIKVVFKLMVMWTSLTWILFPILAFNYGYNGVAIASAIVSTSSIAAFLIARKYLDFSLMSALKNPSIASLIMGITMWFLRSYLANTLLGVITLSFAGAFSYLSVLWLLQGRELMKDLRLFTGAFKRSE